MQTTTTTAVPPPRLVPRERAPTSRLSPREEDILVAFATALMPAVPGFPGACRDIIRKFHIFLEGATDAQWRVVKALLWAGEMAAVATHGRPFTSLSPPAREKMLASWAAMRSFHARSLLRAIATPIKAAHFDDPELFRRVACTYEAPRGSDEPARWRQRITDGRAVSEDLDLECEVVVVGSGAGGAAAAFELARRGRAVLLLEEGDFHTRSDFTGRASRAFRTLYRDRGITVALGNVGVPVWAGRGVGGTTTVNSGTCYRTPERTFRRWREEFGLPLDYSSQGLDPYYARVEAMLGVERAEEKYLGRVASIVARGADAMGLREHGALFRNAPGCDGRGMCCYGCPSGAKRSTDVSYVPEALKHGAELVTGANVTHVDVVAGRARGVTAKLASGKTLRVRAEAVIVAGGALMTPLLLARSKCCRTSDWLGKNLSIHPASRVMALFDESVDMANGIPQSYGVESFADEGLMLEGGSAPLDVTMLGVPWTGTKLMELAASYRHLAMFGFMIQDESRGRVREGLPGSPLLFYNLGKRDLLLMQKGLVVLSEIFLRAGAKRVFPFVVGHDEIRTERDLARLRSAKVRAGDFDVAAFHPLGTCRMGSDPRTSCVGPDHQAHDVEGLYVCDGSVMPTSLGVNPQLTIMAMALRAAETIDARLA